MHFLISNLSNSLNSQNKSIIIPITVQEFQLIHYLVT